jgi:esterase/lipase
MAVGAGLGITAVALGLGPVGWTLLGIGGLAVVGSGGWAALRQFLWRDELIYKRMLKLQERMHNEIKQKQSALQKDLEQIKDSRGTEQLENLSAKFKLVSKRLEERFNASEVTFVRYIGTAEQVYLGALDNLRAVVEASEALDTMDKDRLIEQRETCAAMGKLAEGQNIQARIDMYERYEKSIRAALSDNEAAITRLSQVLEALVNLNTGQGMAKAPLEEAMAELSRLAERTKEYGIQ